MAENFFSLPGPIELTPGPGRTRAASFQKFSDYVRYLGGDPRAILERHDIDPRRVSDPEHHVASRAMVETFQYCADALKAPLFGFHLAELQSSDVFGAVSTLCRSAPDLRRALRDFMDYLPVVHSPEYEMKLIEAGGAVELSWFRHSSDYGRYDQANHHALLRIVNLFRSLAGDTFRLQYAHISTGVTGTAKEELEAKVGCTVHLDQTADRIGIAVSALDLPLLSANRVVHEVLGAYLQRVRAAQQLSLRERVEAYVRGVMSSGELNLERCARKIGIPARTLQHQLRALGTSFSDIVTDQRMTVARDYLAEGRLSVGEIALTLGYAEQTSFGRAFKKWSGRSPGQFGR